MTDHPCKGLTPAMRRVFEAIATGDALPRSASPKTIARLLGEGLIERISDKVLGKDRFGAISIPQYEVPIHHHVHFCRWASEKHKGGKHGD